MCSQRLQETQEVRMNSWQLACNDELIMATDPMKLYPSMRICSLHFEDHLMEKHKLKENAVPTLNLVVSLSGSIHEEHSYFSDENKEVGHFMEIDSSEDGMNTRARSIGTQTEPDMVGTGTQTLVQKSDSQVQTEKQLSAITPRKIKLIKKINVAYYFLHFTDLFFIDLIKIFIRNDVYFYFICANLP
ncbi:unnamed protein product [Phaedon cochleariae]|uniref:THAP-type domain-containing protein n=1 Tax=Phaedon cochleariae TaxID=80249 RepID=A0A9N9X421_PHACE|nr:unnamed protein product [Phaedon cochleariae]